MLETSEQPSKQLHLRFNRGIEQRLRQHHVLRLCSEKMRTKKC